jgi:hypothetical protein
MKKLLWICLVIVAIAAPLRSQDDGKAYAIFEDAVQAMGGDAFLNVRDMVSSGNYFAFDRFGASSPLIKFTDYTKLPDKSRYELGNKKNSLEITVFNLEKNEGWIVEGQKGTRAATPDEMRDFKDTVKHSLEIIFRTRYKDPQNKLFYLGPGDGREVNLDKVRLIDPDNDEVTVYFDRMSKLPQKIEFERRDQKGVRQRVVHEYSQWHWIQGVRASLRTDGYINGHLADQSHIVDIKFNNDLPDSLFAEPVPEK